MKVEEAFALLCKHYGIRPVMRQVIEYEKWYGFRVSPPGSERIKRVFTAPMILVNKRNGKISDEYSIPEEDISVEKMVRNRTLTRNTTSGNS